MVDVEKIISDFEKVEYKKKEELNAKLAAELNKFIQNAKDIETFITQTVCPIFESVKARIVQAGYPCEVDKVLRKIRNDGSGKEYVLEIKLKTTSLQHGAGAFGQYLLCKGDYIDASITCEVKISEGSLPKKPTAYPIAHYTHEKIQSEVENLLIHVFPSEQATP